MSRTCSIPSIHAIKHSCVCVLVCHVICARHRRRRWRQCLGCCPIRSISNEAMAIGQRAGRTQFKQTTHLAVTFTPFSSHQQRATRQTRYNPILCAVRHNHNRSSSRETTQILQTTNQTHAIQTIHKYVSSIDRLDTISRPRSYQRIIY